MRRGKRNTQGLEDPVASGTRQERRDSQHKGHRREGERAEEPKGRGSSSKGRLNPKNRCPHHSFILEHCTVQYFINICQCLGGKLAATFLRITL